jgi:hypothetical protein
VNVVSFILCLAAAVLFVVAGLVPPYSYRLVSLGLALFSVGFIIEAGAKTHTITF